MNSNVIIAKLKMIDSGILPAMTGKELSKMLSSLDEKERRKVSRKFRKIWRKLAKKDSGMRKTMEIGNKDPNKNIMRARAATISVYFVKNVALKAKLNQHQEP
tara:strand:- start:7864 stop:8172 length:309 start_codon:yes stop_codon:yes gene_type:complete